MKKVAGLLTQLHDAETDLAAEFRKVAERHAVEHDVWHLGHSLAEQCEARAERIREWAEMFDKDLHAPTRVPLWDDLLAAVRRTTSELSGRRPETGLLLLRDLRELYLAAHGVDALWIMIGQVAQALRDQQLLGQVDELHRQLLTQVKWLKTKMKESTPQAITVG